MDGEQIKGMREVEIFTQFVTVAKLPIDLRTIEKRKAPAPDILCTHREIGPVAFELTEICDPSLAKFFSEKKKGGAYYIRTADPSRRIIRKKLRRKYQTKHPIELLSYTQGRVGTPPLTMILEQLRLSLKSFKNVFRRAWLMSHGHVHVVWPTEERE